MPALNKALDPPTRGKLMGVVMKRFRIMVYTCIGLLLLTGAISGVLHDTSADPGSVDKFWNMMLGIKIGVYFVMVFLAVYAFEFLAPKVARIAANGPSPELARAQKTQMLFAGAGFVMGIIVVALSAAL